MFRRAASVGVILFVALIVWLPTIGWGLPSRDADRFLFGERRPWTGAEIVALTAPTQPTAARGADVDADPILDRSKPVLLNDTDAKRAAIVRRYRLMSGQPDEFIQFKALGEMAARPGLAKLDPRLYQYGGLWMYPVGAMIRASMLVGLIPTPPAGTPAMEFYLDHPEAFGRFYVVARFYSWCWGVVAAFAIVWIARRITGSLPLATIAAVAFMLTPVVRTATHEAKPHLAGAALCLCAVIAATKYVETGRRRWMLAAGALCGAAMAMVVSMLLSCVVLPVMCWLRWCAIKRSDKPTAVRSDRASSDDATATATHAPTDPTPQGSAWIALIASLACAAIVYVATNPFVLVNAIAHPEILRSNLGNSTAMYSPGSDGLQAVRSAWRIASASVGDVTLIATACAAVVGSVRLIRRNRLDAATALLLSVASIVACQFAVLSAGKPAEYGRFAIIVVAAGFVMAAASLHGFAKVGRTRSVVAGLIALVTVFGLVRADAIDGPAIPKRIATIVLERQMAESPSSVVGTFYEPAPWSAPPANLFDAQILLLPREKMPHDINVLIWPTNLASQVRSIEAVQSESTDWKRNGFEVRWIAVNSNSDRSEYHPASRTAPTSRGR